MCLLGLRCTRASRVQVLHMPTLPKPALAETEVPWLDIWERMNQGLLPHARKILCMLGYYVKRDMSVPATDAALSEDEQGEITEIVSALTIAAVEGQRIPDGVLVATLKKVAK